MISSLVLGGLAVAVAPLMVGLSQGMRRAGENADGQRTILQLLEQLRTITPASLQSQATGAFGCQLGTWSASAKTCARAASAVGGEELVDPMTAQAFFRTCTFCEVRDGSMDGFIVRVALRWLDSRPASLSWAEINASWSQQRQQGKAHERVVQMFKRRS